MRNFSTFVHNTAKGSEGANFVEKAGPAEVWNENIRTELKRSKVQQNLLLFIMLPIITVIGFLLWRVKVEIVRISVESVNGVWDLTDMDFSSGCAYLIGDVEHAPYTLLTPEEFELSEDIVIGKHPNGMDYVTSRIRILVPDGNYSFARFTPDFASRIYVNGEWLADFGQPGTSEDTIVRDERLMVFTAQPVDGVITIVQQSANFTHWENSGHVKWSVGTQEAIDTWATSYKAVNAINIAFYLFLFIVHLMLFLLLPTYWPNFWLALLCLVWMLRAGITGSKLFLTLIPVFSLVAAFRIEYLTLPVSIILLIITYYLAYCETQKHL